MSREEEAQQRAIRLGLSLLRIVGEERLTYLLQTESEMSLEQVEEFLTMLEAGNGR